METLFERYRNLMVLLAMLLAQIIGLASQVHRGDAGHMSLDQRDTSGVRLIRLWANAVVSPPERFFHGIWANSSYVWNNYFDLRHVNDQNKDLQQTIDRLRLEQAALMEDARQGQRLQSMLGFQEKYIYQTLPAQIIGTSGSEQSRLVTIDKGANMHLERDMAVITADGIVGKVREVFGHSAQVLLINDQTSGAGVILETTRIRGVLRGNAVGQPQIVGLTNDSRILPGERILTAGGDEIFPRGLPVGTVDKVIKDPDQDGFIKIIVKPAAHLDRLDEVLVVTSVQPRFPPDQKQDMTDSETIKGAEVEREKAQKASEVMAERLPGLIVPNVPADQQPLNDSSNPNPVAHPPQAIRPDRFTPGTDPNNGGASAPANTEPSAAPQPETAKPAAPAPAQKKPAAKPSDQNPGRNP
ncbi:MAG TPA: rod shape-determining protein MreC [Terracidiphilus sp.]|jgi:rod shape-determining protein MreC|nr:rod shape-determining protein MreC [Terracidiphilus sp.]